MSSRAAIGERRGQFHRQQIPQARCLHDEVGPHENDFQLSTGCAAHKNRCDTVR